MNLFKSHFFTLINVFLCLFKFRLSIYFLGIVLLLGHSKILMGDTTSLVSWIDSQNYFSINLPVNWEKKENINGFLVASFSPFENDSDQYREFCGIKTINIPINKEDEIPKNILEKYSKDLFGTYTLTLNHNDNGVILVNGKSIQWTSTKYRFEELQLQVLSFYYHANKTQIIQLSCHGLLDAYPRYRVEFENIVKSLKTWE